MTHKRSHGLVHTCGMLKTLLILLPCCNKHAASNHTCVGALFLCLFLPPAVASNPSSVSVPLSSALCASRLMPRGLSSL